MIPETVLTYSDQGFGRLSRNLHRCFRRHLCRGRYRDQVRPILVNSWEADYFHFTGESICRLPKRRRGWALRCWCWTTAGSGKRDDDNSSLGDWTVNEEKLGCTMGELIRRVNDLG